jgi:hypothetical protein
MKKERIEAGKMLRLLRSSMRSRLAVRNAVSSPEKKADRISMIRTMVQGVDISGLLVAGCKLQVENSVIVICSL